MLAPRHTPWAVPAGLVVTVLITTLFLGASLRGPWEGGYLFRDFVTVPDPVLGANILGGDGAPRAVPLDAVVATLSSVLPSGLVARLLLVSPLLLVGAGMSVLLRRHGAVATSVGAALAIANPYAVERLLLGQAPSLLGYAMIPWLVVAVRLGQPLTVRVLAVLLAAAPAALTPVGAVMAGITVLVTALVIGPRERAETGRPVEDSQAEDRSSPAWRALGWQSLEAVALLAPVGLLSVPWILAGLQDPSAGAVAEGADAFAVRSDGYLAVAGSVATLGGVWAEGAWLGSRDNGFVTLLSLFLVLGAVGAWFVLRRAAVRAPRAAGGPAAPSRRSVELAGAGYTVTVVAVIALAGPLLPVWRTLQAVPGLALMRDTHRWLGWAALAVAALLAVGLAQALRQLDSTRLAAAGASVTLVALGVVTVPDAPGRLAHDLRPVVVPAEWEQVVTAVNEVPEGRVLLLPWQPFRQVDWAGPVQFLDPLPRALEPEAVHARDLLVRRGDQEVLVGGEDPAWAAELGTADGSLDADQLRDEGISRVVVWLESPGELPGGLGDLDEVHRGEQWLVLEVPDATG